MKVKLCINVGIPGGRHIEEIEVDDDTTDDQLDQMAHDMLSNHVSWWWEKVESSP